MKYYKEQEKINYKEQKKYMLHMISNGIVMNITNINFFESIKIFNINGSYNKLITNPIISSVTISFCFSTINSFHFNFEISSILTMLAFVCTSKMFEVDC